LSSGIFYPEKFFARIRPSFTDQVKPGRFLPSSCFCNKSASRRSSPGHPRPFRPSLWPGEYEAIAAIFASLFVLGTQVGAQIARAGVTDYQM
jgi:hypothetical protein